MAAGSAGEGAGSNTELRWRPFSRLVCQSEMELACRTSVVSPRSLELQAATTCYHIIQAHFRAVPCRSRTHAHAAPHRAPARCPAQAGKR